MTSDYQNAVNQCGTLTSTNAIFNGSTASTIGGSITGQLTTGYVYTYPYPYTPPAQTYYWPTYVPVENTQHAARIAELEGEVKVLRDMVAALVGGGQNKPKARRKV